MLAANVGGRDSLDVGPVRRDYPAGGHDRCLGSGPCRGTLVMVDGAETPPTVGGPRRGGKAGRGDAPTGPSGGGRGGGTPPRPPAGSTPDPDEPLPDDWLRRTVDEATDAERNALRDWTGPGHRDIQAALRGQAPLTDDLRRRIGHIDAALARTALPRAVRLRRLAGADSLGVDRAEDVAQAVGRMIDAAGYLAATVSDTPPKMPGRQRVIIDLLVPAGVPAGYLERVSVAPQQREMLLARSLKMFVVRARYDQRMQRWIVSVLVAGAQGSP